MLMLATLVTTGCSVFGHSDVEIAPYEILKKDNNFELRHYDRLVLVSTPMSGLNERRSPFSRLFNYISGENTADQSIAMTAPVFMDQESDNSEAMSFVLPQQFSYQDAPQPQDPLVTLEELSNYTVATVTFNGRLSQDNIEKHKALLQKWITQNNYVVTGMAKAAGYNPPFTIPAMRRNEVLIPVEKP